MSANQIQPQSVCEQSHSEQSCRNQAQPETYISASQSIADITNNILSTCEPATPTHCLNDVHLTDGIPLAAATSQRLKSNIWGKSLH